MSTLHAALDDGRLPVQWCTYLGDQRSILNPANNPVATFPPLNNQPLGRVAGFGALPASLVGQLANMRGPNSLGEPMWPVVADYDPLATPCERCGVAAQMVCVEQTRKPGGVVETFVAAPCPGRGTTHVGWTYVRPASEAAS